MLPTSIFTLASCYISLFLFMAFTDGNLRLVHRGYAFYLLRIYQESVLTSWSDLHIMHITCVCMCACFQSDFYSSQVPFEFFGSFVFRVGEFSISRLFSLSCDSWKTTDNRYIDWFWSLSFIGRDFIRDCLVGPILNQKLPVQNVCIFKLVILTVSPKIFLLRKNICIISIISGIPIFQNQKKECKAIIYTS